MDKEAKRIYNRKYYEGHKWQIKAARRLLSSTPTPQASKLIVKPHGITTDARRKEKLQRNERPDLRNAERSTRRVNRYAMLSLQKSHVNLL